MDVRGLRESYTQFAQTLDGVQMGVALGLNAVFAAGCTIAHIRDGNVAEALGTGAYALTFGAITGDLALRRVYGVGLTDTTGEIRANAQPHQ